MNTIEAKEVVIKDRQNKSQGILLQKSRRIKV